jgi:hypothetical protein
VVAQRRCTGEKQRVSSLPAFRRHSPNTEAAALVRRHHLLAFDKSTMLTPDRGCFAALPARATEAGQVWLVNACPAMAESPDAAWQTTVTADPTSLTTIHNHFNHSHTFNLLWPTELLILLPRPSSLDITHYTRLKERNSQHADQVWQYPSSLQNNRSET